MQRFRFSILLVLLLQTKLVYASLFSPNRISDQQNDSMSCLNLYRLYRDALFQEV